MGDPRHTDISHGYSPEHSCLLVHCKNASERMHMTTLSSPHLSKHISSPSENQYQVLLLLYLHYTTLVTGFLPLPGCQFFAAALLSSCLYYTEKLYWFSLITNGTHKQNFSYICQNKTLLFVSLFYVLLWCLLSAVDLLGMFGKHIKGQKFPLLSQEPNIVHFWSVAAVMCADPISFLSLWGCACSWFCMWFYCECLSCTFSIHCSNASRHMEQG